MRERQMTEWDDANLLVEPVSRRLTAPARSANAAEWSNGEET
jgi:hypothetical protein